MRNALKFFKILQWQSVTILPKNVSYEGNSCQRMSPPRDDEVHITPTENKGLFCGRNNCKLWKKTGKSCNVIIFECFIFFSKKKKDVNSNNVSRFNFFCKKI